VFIDLIIAWWSMAFHKFGKHQRALQLVDVIVRSLHVKELMPNPKVIICHSFKHHTAISMKPFVHVRNRQVVFPGGQRPQHIVTCTCENMQETP
jgi:hypothetical protein